MSENIKKWKIVLRNDTASNWTAVGDEVVLLQGEIGVEFPDDGSDPKMKMGDGISVWNELPYLDTDDNSELENKVTTSAW